MIRFIQNHGKDKLRLIGCLALCLLLAASVIPALPAKAAAKLTTVTLQCTPPVQLMYSESVDEVTPGTIRYVNQSTSHGSQYYYADYWKRSPSSQCNIACISMALSYIGINRLPAEIKRGSSVEQAVENTDVFVSRPTSVEEGVDLLITGNGKYSPVILDMNYYAKAKGRHWVIVVGKISENVYQIVDPAFGLGEVNTATIKGSSIKVDKTTSTISRIYQLYNPASYIAGPNDPLALLVSATSKASGQITVKGWAFDPDAPDSPVRVYVYVDGEMGTGAPKYQFLADKKRADVNEKYGISGKHGFSQTLSGKRVGEHTLYFYVMNQGEGELNPLFAVKTVSIKDFPSIAKATVSNVKTKTRTGQAITQKPVVKMDEEKLKEGEDYTISYSNNKLVGTAKMTIKGVKGRYSGKQTVSFTIRPAQTQIHRLYGGSRKITVKWKAQTSQTSGYQIQYATSADFSRNRQSQKVRKMASDKLTITGLSARKTYYVRIRTYKLVNGKTYYAAWSEVKKVRTK